MDTRLLETKLAEYGLADARDRILSAARPCVAVNTTPLAEDRVGISRMGGDPDLPPGLAWPSWNDQPMGFLGQFDLAELPTGADLGVPAAGLLAFFFPYDWGAASRQEGAGRVLWLPDPRGLVRTATPAHVPRYEPCGVRLSLQLSLPESEHAGAQSIGMRLSQDEQDRYSDLFSLRHEALGYEADHQLFGLPVAVQNDVLREVHLESVGMSSNEYFDLLYRKKDQAKCQELMAAAREWWLLAQFGEDERLGMTWVDSGRLSFLYPRNPFPDPKRVERPWTCLQFD